MNLAGLVAPVPVRPKPPKRLIAVHCQNTFVSEVIRIRKREPTSIPGTWFVTQENHARLVYPPRDYEYGMSKATAPVKMATALEHAKSEEHHVKYC